MKKVLFATTALIAAGSMAAADVRISGYGRFGLDYNDRNSTNMADANYNGISKTTITSRLRLQFDMSTETDSGVVLGARFRAQAESRDNRGASGPISFSDINGDGVIQANEVSVGGGAVFNGARFFATYEGFSLGVGNIIGAVENMPGLYLETRTAGIGIDGASFYSNVANVNNEFFNWDAYSSAGFGANGFEVIYTGGGFVGHLSYSQDNDTLRVGAAPIMGTDRLAAMVAYQWDAWQGAIAYQNGDNGTWEDKIIAAVSYDADRWGVRLAYADNDGIGKWGLYGNYDIGAASNILIFWTDEQAVDAADVAAGRGDNRDSIVGSNMNEGSSYGIHYSYDLGGGASFEAGYRRASNDNDTFQAGVYFSF